MLEQIWRNATVWNPVDIPRIVPNDPDDDHVLACALVAEADVIVTGDEHLLALGNYNKTAIITPQAFIKILR